MFAELPRLAPELQAQITLGDEAILVVTAAAQRITHDQSLAQIHAVALYASIIELFSATLLLAKCGEPTAVPVLLRPIYEALVDLDNLLSDTTYVEYMQAANYKETIKLMQSVALRPLADRHLGVLEQYMAAREELRAKGIEPLKIWQRCKRANREDQYNSLYGLFCMDAHNNSAALADRHMSESPDGTDNVKISIFGDYDPQSVSRRISFGLQFLLEAAQMMHGAFRVSAPEVDALIARADRQRAGNTAAPSPSKLYEPISS